MKLSIFLVAIASVLACSYAELKIRHKECVFPFVYKGKTYNHCTRDDGKNYWCSTDAEYKEGFRDCLPSGCTFPFQYKGKTYNTCTKDGSSKYWCSKDKIYNEVFFECKNYEEGPEERVEVRTEKVTKKVGCIDQEEKMRKIGERWTYRCSTFLCSEKPGADSLIEAKCEGKFGCHALGQDGYACVIKGKTYDSCSCQKRDNKLWNIAEEVIETIEVRKGDQRETKTDNNQRETKTDNNQRETKTDNNQRETKTDNRQREIKIDDTNVKQTKTENKFREERVDEENEEKKEVVCTDQRKTRRQENERWEFECKTYQCKEEGPVVIAAKCKGKFECQPLGKSGYRCDQNGKTYEQCMCSGKGTNPVNLVDETSEVVEGCTGQDNRKHRIGEKWVHQCVTYLCAKGGRIQFQSAKCQDLMGQCRDIGSSDYKCSINGKPFEDCVCKGDAMQPFQEGTIPVGAKDVKRTQIKLCFDPTGKEASSWKDGCTEFVCENGESRVKKQRCRDDEDKCYDLNTRSPCTMSGRKWKQCECEMFGDAPTLNAGNG